MQNYGDFLKFLFSSVLIFNSLFASVDADGWASVERPKKNSFEETLQEEDPTVWVVFAKKLGSEKFLVRFPDDPKYTYLTPDEMEISSGNHSLRILKPSSQFFEERKKQIETYPDTLLVEAKQTAPNTFDLFYQMKGKWIWERILLTPHHLYFFQTKNDVLISEGHEQFIHSLNLETID